MDCPLGTTSFPQKTKSDSEIFLFHLDLPSRKHKSLCLSRPKIHLFRSNKKDLGLIIWSIQVSSGTKVPLAFDIFLNFHDVVWDVHQPFRL